MKNILSDLNGWQRLFIVITLLIQLPITIFAITEHKEYIDAKFITAKLKSLNEKESSPYKVEIFNLWDVSQTTYIPLSDLNVEINAVPKVENKNEIESKVAEARRSGYTDKEIVEFLNKEWKIDTTKARTLGINDTVILNKIIAQSQNIFRFIINVGNNQNKYAVAVDGSGTSEQLRETASNVHNVVEDFYKINFIKNSIFILSISALISLIVYVVGYALGWVYKGFKK
jgi:hypothetical protein